MYAYRLLGPAGEADSGEEEAGEEVAEENDAADDDADDEEDDEEDVNEEMCVPWIGAPPIPLFCDASIRENDDAFVLVRSFSFSCMHVHIHRHKYTCAFVSPIHWQY